MGLPWGWLGLLETTTSKVRVPSRVSRNSLKRVYGTGNGPALKISQMLMAGAGAAEDDLASNTIRERLRPPLEYWPRLSGGSVRQGPWGRRRRDN